MSNPENEEEDSSREGYADKTIVRKQYAFSTQKAEETSGSFCASGRLCGFSGRFRTLGGAGGARWQAGGWILMRHVEERVDSLNRLPRPWRVAALADTLRHAGDDEVACLARTLLAELEGLPARSVLLRRADRDRLISRATMAFVESWARLTPQTRAEIRQIAGDRLTRTLHEMVGADEDRLREAAALATPDMGSPAAIADLPRLLLDENPEVVLAAESAFVEISGSNTSTGALDAAFDEALVAAARSYPEHRRRGVMYAIARVATSPGPAVGAWLRDGREPGHMALRAVIRQATDPGTRGDCMRWLGSDALAPAAIDRLTRPGGPAEHEAALSQWHLLLVPSRRARLRTLDRPRDVLPPQEIVGSLSDAARRGRLEMLRALRIGVEQRAAVIADALGDPNSCNRHASVRLLAERLERDSAARGALADFMFDADPRIAGTALLAATCNEATPSVAQLHALERSASARIRSLAGRLMENSGPWRRTLPMSRRAIAGLLILRDDARGFLVEARRRLQSREVEVVQDAVLLCERLRILPEVELELLAAIASEDAHVVATVMRALRHVETSASLSARLAGLEHHDARVRANAVEALADVDALRSLMDGLFEDKAGRVRANAIRVGLASDSPEIPARALAEMLSDRRVDHRDSALWVVERLGRAELAERVAEIARDDEYEPTQARARRCARRLLATMRADWSSPVDVTPALVGVAAV